MIVHNVTMESMTFFYPSMRRIDMVIPIGNHEAPVDTEMVEADGAQDGEQQPTITHTSPTSATEGVMLPGSS